MAHLDLLHPDVSSAVEASSLIRSLPEVVYGLVVNSLDAGATGIDISVDFSRGYCSVEDNGPGILLDESGDAARLGQPYCTSKRDEFARLGPRKGLFIAALSRLCILNIYSMDSDSSRTKSWRSIFGTLSSSSNTSSDWNDGEAGMELGHGTRIIVQDLFGNMPVRLQARPSFTEVPVGSTVKRLWRELVDSLAAAYIAWDSKTYLRIQMRGQPDRLIWGQRMNTLERSGSISVALAKPNSSSWLEMQKLGEIMHKNSSTNCKFDEVSASSDHFDVFAIFGQIPQPTRRYQYMSYFSTAILPLASLKTLHDTVDKCFVNSDFGSLQDQTMNKRLAEDMIVNHHPAFAIKIVPKSVEGHAFGVHHTKQTEFMHGLTELLIHLSTHYLKERFLNPKVPRNDVGFRPTRPSRPRSSMSDIRPSSVSSYLSGIKGSRPVSRAAVSSDEAHDLVLRPQSALSRAENIENDSGQNFEESCPQNHDGSGDFSTSNGTVWLCPQTAQTVIVDPRTGMEINVPAASSTTLPSQPKAPNQTRQKLSVPPRLTKFGKLNNGSSAKAPEKDTWVGSVLQDWQNPVFSGCEKSIEQCQSHDLNAENKSHTCLHGEHTMKNAAELSVRFTKQDLQDCQVIGQVDRKFILVTIPSVPSVAGKNLAKHVCLIDQHAADERVRYEGLLGQYYHQVRDQHPREVSATALDESPAPAIALDLKANEEELFQTHQDFFRHWGIRYDISNQENQGTAVNTSSLCIQSLPEMFSERLRTNPKLLLQVLLRSIQELEERLQSGASSKRTRVRGGQTLLAWLQDLKDCPAALLEMIQSRACRSAIMFNDVLDQTECEALVTRLAECQLPFFCAHGRPSLMPLTIVSTDSTRAEAFGGASWQKTSHARRSGHGAVPDFAAWRHG